MKQPKIQRVELIETKRPQAREIKVTLTNGTVITIAPCYESWIQWGGTQEELWLTAPIAEAQNDWLHGLD